MEPKSRPQRRRAQMAPGIQTERRRPAPGREGARLVPGPPGGIGRRTQPAREQVEAGGGSGAVIRAVEMEMVRHAPRILARHTAVDQEERNGEAEGSLLWSKGE